VSSKETWHVDVTARASTRIHASRQDVWQALTDPTIISEYYLGATVSTDWQVGSPITWSGEWNGTAYTDKGEILAVEPGRLLSYSHWSPTSGTEDSPQHYHVVTITLSAAGDRTDVELKRSNLKGGVSEADRRHRDDYESNWSTMLDGLKKSVEERIRSH
jgi:uncharacterized protein YndB with AHSA1/START domain